MTLVEPGRIESALAAIRPERLLQHAIRLCAAPSPTCSARPALDELAAILAGEGLAVERPEADWAEAPAVLVRFDSGRPGRTLQFTGHLDTVPLPFVPPTVEGGILRGSGASDMKGGMAAAVEALLALRDSGALTHGGILLTSYDLHEGPWGDAHQLHALLRDGVFGDGVLIPEYLADRLPLAGRGLGIFEARIRRPGIPVHEVLRPAGTADVLATGCELVRRLHSLSARWAQTPHPLAGAASFFVGHIQAGEIFNQSPVECRVDGTRRWLPGQSQEKVRADFEALLAQLASETGTTIESGYMTPGDAFELSPDEPLVRAFDAAYAHVTGGRSLPVGAKPFLDDGNAFMGRAGIPALTHGPAARGAHTTHEEVPVAELERVARTYAVTALHFCSAA